HHHRYGLAEWKAVPRRIEDPVEAAQPTRRGRLDPGCRRRERRAKVRRWKVGLDSGAPGVKEEVEVELRCGERKEIRQVATDTAERSVLDPPRVDRNLRWCVHQAIVMPVLGVRRAS